MSKQQPAFRQHRTIRLRTVVLHSKVGVLVIDTLVLLLGALVRQIQNCSKLFTLTLELGRNWLILVQSLLQLSFLVERHSFLVLESLLVEILLTEPGIASKHHRPNKINPT